MRKQWWRVYGFTLDEIAKHMKITPQRVHQLALKKSLRINSAVKQMKK
jgi:hypothetical protein